MLKVMGLVAAVMGTLLTSQWVAAFEYSLEFTQADIQAQVDAILPIKKETFLAVVTLDQAKVVFVEDSDHLVLEAKLFLTSVAGINSQGTVSVRGGISYNSSKGAFYFHQAKITSLNMNGVPPEFVPTLTDLAQQGLTQALARHPVYVLKEDDMKQKLIKSSLKSVVIKDQKLKATMGI